MNKNGLKSRIQATAQMYFQFENAMLIIATIVCVVALLAQVVWRYVLNTPLRWSEELARYLYVWMTFVGMGFGVRYNSHIRMLFFRSKMRPRTGTIVTLVADSILIVLVVQLIPGLIDFTGNQFGVRSTGMNLNMGLVYISLPVGFGILTMYLTAQVIRSVLSLFKRDSQNERVND